MPGTGWVLSRELVLLLLSQNAFGGHFPYRHPLFALVVKCALGRDCLAFPHSPQLKAALVRSLHGSLGMYLGTLTAVRTSYNVRKCTRYAQSAQPWLCMVQHSLILLEVV